MNKKFSKLLLTSASAVALLAAYPSVAQNANEALGLDLPSITAEAATTAGNAFVKRVMDLPNVSTIASKTPEEIQEHSREMRDIRKDYNRLSSSDKDATVEKWAGYLYQKERAIGNVFVDIIMDLHTIAEIEEFDTADFAAEQKAARRARNQYDDLSQVAKENLQVVKWLEYLDQKEQPLGITFVDLVGAVPNVSTLKGLSETQLEVANKSIAAAEASYDKLSDAAKGDALVGKWLGYLADKKEAIADLEVIEEELTVESVSAINATTISVTFEGMNPVEVTLDTPLLDGQKEVEFTYDGNDYNGLLDTPFVDGDLTSFDDKIKANEEEILSLQKEGNAANKALDEANIEVASKRAAYDKIKNNDKASKAQKEAAKKALDEAIEARDEQEKVTKAVITDNNKKINELEEENKELEAEKAVVKYEKSHVYNNDYTDANTKVTYLKTGDKKTELEGRLAKALEAAKVEIAKDAVEEAEKSLTLADYNTANEKVGAVADSQVKRNLKARLDKVDELRQEAKDVITALTNIPSKDGIDDLNLEDAKKKVEAARDAYDELNDAQKALIPEDKVTKLEDSEARIKEVEKIVSELNAAKPVIEMIKNIPADTVIESEDDSEEAIQAVVEAREAYDALDEAVQKRVTNLNRLESKERKVNEVKAAEVDKLIAAIASDAPVSPELRAKVSAAREAYDNLSEDAQKLVSENNVAKLKAVEAKIELADKK